jgi:hypothetical protein
VTSLVSIRRRYDVYIGRPSKWGNPFVPGRDGTSTEVTEKYEQHVRSRMDLVAALPELEGKTLGCCGKLHCHGHVLVKLVTERLWEIL